MIKTLKLSRALKFNIRSDGKIYAQLSKSNGEFYLSPEVLAILSYFAEIRSFEQTDRSSQELLSYLKNHFKEILNTLPNNSQCKHIVDDLIAAGFLVTESNKTERNLQNDGFGDPWVQWAMLADEQRSMSYINALSQKITHQSVVLDVGSGTGFLAASALNSGAKKVYAIEESNIAQNIKKNLQSLNLIDKKNNKNNFHLYAQNSYDVELSPDINLVVSELFGNDPFQEGLYSTLRDISQRLKHKNIEFIPKKIVLYGEMINLLDHYAKPRIQKYQTAYHSEFEQKHNKNALFYHKFLTKNKIDLGTDAISFPIHLTEKNFERISQTEKLGESLLNPPPVSEQKFIKSFSGEKIIHLHKTKVRDKQDTPLFVVWFRVYLTDDISISSHPQESDYACHWSPIAVILNKKIDSQSKLKIKHQLSCDAGLFECQIFEDDFLIGSRRFL